MTSKSQILDFGRLLSVIRHDVVSNGRQWLLRAMMMTGVIALLLYFTTKGLGGLIDGEAGQISSCAAVFKFCGALFIALGASQFMENMTSNGQRLNVLMLPASQLEKFLSRAVICVLGVGIAYLLCFMVADGLKVLFIKLFSSGSSDVIYVGIVPILQSAEKWYYGFFGLAALQATFVLGSVIWPKGSFLKTFGVMVLIGIAMGLIFSSVAEWYWTVSPIEFSTGSVPRTVNIMHYNWWFSGAWIVFCYVTAYFRFKESEVIHRF